MLKIIIEIPVEVVEPSDPTSRLEAPLAAAELKKLRDHLEQYLEKNKQHIGPFLGAGPHMLGTVCWFMFGKPKWKVE